jgi:hypothetical protein
MGLKFQGKNAQPLPVGPGTLGKHNGRIGSTLGERQRVAKQGQTDIPDTVSPFRQVANFLGSKISGKLVHPDDGFEKGTPKHPIQAVGEGKKGSSLYGDPQLLAYLNIIAPGQKKP